MAYRSASTYSFAQVTATLVYQFNGAPVTLILSEGGVGEEGIEIESALDTNNMKNGADGSVQHSLRIARPAHLKLSVMRNNELNNQLSLAFNNTTSTAASHGLMSITIIDSTSGEQTICTGVAFKKLPSNSYKQDAEPLVWEFDVGNILYTAGINTDGGTAGGGAGDGA